MAQYLLVLLLVLAANGAVQSQAENNDSPKKSPHPFESFPGVPPTFKYPLNAVLRLTSNSHTGVNKVIANGYLFALSILLLASNGQALAQSSTDSRVDKLEETVRTLERRVSTLEDQLHQGVAAPSIPQSKANWRRLQQGLSETDVERLLGSPTRVDAYGTFTIWNYGEDGAKVQFDAKTRTVTGWHEP
ncbi:hypothetical protein ACQKP5_28670 [Pseudomonas vancouverensis]|uniref:hypothetical protein n=1 Tax=Pseudomonas vancouverensis TaxID=95300 RepID=UPI003CFBEBA9